MGTRSWALVKYGQAYPRVLLSSAGHSIHVGVPGSYEQKGRAEPQSFQRVWRHFEPQQKIGSYKSLVSLLKQDERSPLPGLARWAFLNATGELSCLGRAGGCVCVTCKQVSCLHEKQTYFCLK